MGTSAVSVDSALGCSAARSDRRGTAIMVQPGSRSPAPQDFVRDTAVVPGQPLLAEEHSLLVALAGQQNRVTGPGALQEQANRGAAIELDAEVFVDGTCAAGDLLSDGGRVFLARVVHRDHE